MSDTTITSDEYGQTTDDNSSTVLGISFPNDATMLLAMLLGMYLLYVLAGIVIGFPLRGLVNQIGQLTFWIALFAMAALALNVQWGYTGLFNIGIVGFMAIGVYVTAILSKPVFGAGTSAAQAGGFGLPLSIGIIGGMLAAGILGFLAALPALRLRADYLAIVTIALSEIVRFTLLSSTLAEGTVAGYKIGLGGGNGLILDYPDPLEALVRLISTPLDLVTGQEGFLWTAVYIGSIVEAVGTYIPTNPKPVVDSFAYALVLLIALGGYYVVIQRTGNSPFGRVLKAIREDEDVTNALGKNTNKFKIKSFMIGCALMGLVGILWFGSQGSVTPNTFRPRITFYIWIALIIGGAGSTTGSVMGGAIFAAFLFQGPRYAKNVIETVLGDPSAPASFAQAVEPFASAEVAPFLLYTLDNIRQLQLVLMGVVLIVLMHRRPDGLMGHRKEAAASIPLTRPVGRSPDNQPAATDGGESDE